jgi:hypothetical protein
MGIDCAVLALLIAHQGQLTRTLMLEPAGDVLHVIVHLKVTGRERQEALRMLEKKNLESVLAQRALAGVRLISGTSSIAVEGIEIKSKLAEPIELMIHGTARLFRTELGVETAANADPIDLVVLPGDRPVLRATRGAKSGGLKAKMGAGDRVEWVMLVDRPSAH